LLFSGYKGYAGKNSIKISNKQRKKMAENSKNHKADTLQERFLRKVLVRSPDKNSEKRMLTVFLVNGVKLTGTVADFDEQTLLLVREGHSQLIYKHAISTIMPAQPLKPAELEAEA